MNGMTLKEYLDSKQAKYVTIWHSLAYTAAETAALALTHVRGKKLAKTVIVKIDGTLAMAVVSAAQYVDLASLKMAAGAKRVELATEEEFKQRFPDCSVGAMPPFGHLYGMDVFADESLLHDKEIAFNGGSHLELIQMPWAEYVRLAQPKIVRLAQRPKAAVA